MFDEERLSLLRPKIKNDPAAARQGNFYFGLSVMVLLVVFVLILTGVLVSSSPSQPKTKSITFQVSNVPMGIYKKAAVACDNGLCSTVGKAILEKNGSATDAGIAAIICDGVLNMHNLGLGGGGYIVIWDSKTGKAHAFDAYSVAPSNASEEIYLKNPNSMRLGKFSIAVPGHVAGLYEAHRRFGRLSWAELLQPTIDICEKGFKIGTPFAAGISYVAYIANQTSALFPEMKNLISYLTNPKTGKFYKENDTLTCPALAKTLKLLADEGPMTFYNGTLANLILDDFSDFKIPISRRDLLNYQVNTTRKPFELSLPDGLTLFTSRPAASGAAAAFVLNILSGYKFTPESSQDPLTYHRYVEAVKFAYPQMANFGDEAFVGEDVIESRLAKLSSLEFGQKIRRMINDTHTLPLERYILPTFQKIDVENGYDRSTSHISVLDEEGNAFSMTTTINLYFGSLFMGNRTGIVFNDGMSNFALNTSNSLIPPNNFIEPGKRPLTTASPMIFVNRSISRPELAVQLVVGASGSSRIVSSVPYVAMRTLWFGENVKQAVDAGRLQDPLLPDVLYHEQGFPQWVLDFLRERGYSKQAPFGPRHSICQAIQRLPNGTIFAMTDFRKEQSYTDGY